MFAMKEMKPQTNLRQNNPRLARKCTKNCPLEEDKPLLQRRASTPAPTANEAPPIVHDVLRSPGQPLDESTRAFMEPRFNQDFGHVRIHTDAKAAESARAVNALAYTVGRDIVMKRDEYAPATDAGKRLLAHELVHVIQQGGNNRLQKLQVGAAGDVYEQEADRVAERVVGGEKVERSKTHPTPDLIQRVVPALAAAEWIAVGALGYTLAQSAVASTAGDISYSFDEMEGVLLPGGGSDVQAYRTSHPGANIRSYTHTVSTWMENLAGGRAMGIKFGITFNYDGYAIGNISCNILDIYDWPGWGGSVNVNFTPLSLARGGVAAVRITLNLNADRTLVGGAVESRILELDGTSTIRALGSGARVRFNE
ncbi:hypothetical protein THII_2022 [Thioploca ingrica]|uniref:eCIS core domain-containing protein n=1 Tax=Thioploca ingrica TaxID=40754 RepID=A0A090AGM9_9GAMM|nr:hypothetical protein THII_2022 [Thioploca ingrica]